MPIEDRLYVIVREAVKTDHFSSFFDLAIQVHESEPTEFSYNRLEQTHVMQPASIVPYVSLLHFIGIFRETDDRAYECVIDEAEPTSEGVETLVTIKAVAKLNEAGFTKAGYEKVVRRMLRQQAVVLPTLRDVYQAMALQMTEAQFTQLTAIVGVRRNFGFSIVTRRIMLPQVLA